MEFLRKNLKEFCDTMDSSLTVGLMTLLSCLFKPFNPREVRIYSHHMLDFHIKSTTPNYFYHYLRMWLTTNHEWVSWKLIDSLENYTYVFEASQVIIIYSRAKCWTKGSWDWLQILSSRGSSFPLYGRSVQRAMETVERNSHNFSGRNVDGVWSFYHPASYEGSQKWSTEFKLNGSGDYRGASLGWQEWKHEDRWCQMVSDWDVHSNGISTTYVL